MSQPTWTPPPRSGLQRTRDVALTVMAVLVSLFVVFAFYLIFSVGDALDDRLTDPTPAVTFQDPVPDYRTTEPPAGCVGEEPVPGC